ncbi:MAG: hypothetical protein S0880_12915 [Actinomycetota bacterium]|nr:hypothetical protein [Actinomycetota bacterium]
MGEHHRSEAHDRRRFWEEREPVRLRGAHTRRTRELGENGSSLLLYQLFRGRC